MRRSTPLLALACVVACLALVGWKVAVLGYGFDDGPPDERFAIELVVAAGGRGEKARIQLALPTGGALPQVEDERFSNAGLKLAIRSKAGTRTASFSSDGTPPSGPVNASYRFTVRRGGALPEPPRPAPQRSDGEASETVPATDEVVQRLAVELNPTATDDLARVRGVYDFVLDEIASDRTPDWGPAPDAALRALGVRKGGAVARVRLFVALVRALGLPARVVWAVPLEEGTTRRLLVRAEVFVDGAWVSIDPVRGQFGADADAGFVVLRGDGAFLRTEGLDDARLEVSVVRLGVSAWAERERRVLQGESVLDRLSLFRLPPRSQLTFRVLLLVPLGALIVALFRNLVGVPTFGTFMPILIALALRETGALSGLLALVVVVAIGLVGRRLLDGLRLLLVPRLSLLLTLVIAVLAALSLLSARLGLDAWLTVALMPMVILTMTIERLSLVLIEEGVRSALRTTVGTVVVAVAGYLAIQSDALQRIVFTFPELNLLVVAALLLLGRYTGYRLSELLRFRALAASSESP